MTPVIKSISHSLSATTDEVVEVDAVHMLHVDDTHDHGCGCEGCCDQRDHLEAEEPETAQQTDIADITQQQTTATTILGHSIDVAHQFAASIEIAEWVEQVSIDAPEAAIQVSAVASEGAMQSGYTSGGDAASSFNIMVTYGGDLSGSLAQAFADAADYFSQIILADVADLSNGLDDIQIDASLIEIDGAGGILGRAGPQFVAVVEFPANRSNYGVRRR